MARSSEPHSDPDAMQSGTALPEATDTEAVLEVGAGSPVIRVYFHLAEVSLAGDPSSACEVVGYLRLAFGQGNFANRLLNNLGKPARLTLPNGKEQPIMLAAAAPSEAPGYLCAFRLAAQPEGRAA